MKKILLTTLMALLFNCLHAQDKLTYGALIGFNAYDIEIDGPLSAGAGYSGLNLGGYGEYQLNNRLGVRANLLYTSVTEDNFYSISNGTATHIFNSVKINTLQLHGLLKFDVRHTYNRGFYLIGGLRMTNVLSAKADGQEAKSLYKSANFGAMFGFGVNFAKHFGLELIPECNITNTLDSGSNTAKNYGGYFNLTVNIESFLKK